MQHMTNGMKYTTIRIKKKCHGSKDLIITFIVQIV